MLAALHYPMLAAVALLFWMLCCERGEERGASSAVVGCVQFSNILSPKKYVTPSLQDLNIHQDTLCSARILVFINRRIHTNKDCNVILGILSFIMDNGYEQE